MARRKMDIPDETSSGDLEILCLVTGEVEKDVDEIDEAEASKYKCFACGDSFTEEQMNNNLDRCPNCGETDCIDQP
jgi:hypothetical protein